MKSNQRRIGMVRGIQGLSPILASVIMVVIVLVLFVPILAMSTGLTQDIYSFWTMSGQTLTERITIEEATLRLNPSSCQVFVRNNGQTAVKITDIIIRGDDGEIRHYDIRTFSTVNPVSGASVDFFDQGDLVKASISSLLSLVPQRGVTYTIIVVTIQGVSDIYQTKAE